MAPPDGAAGPRLTTEAPYQQDTPAAKEEPALSPEANNMDDGEEAERQQVPQQGRPADCEIEDEEGKKF